MNKLINNRCNAIVSGTDFVNLTYSKIKVEKHGTGNKYLNSSINLNTIKHETDLKVERTVSKINLNMLEELNTDIIYERLLNRNIELEMHRYKNNEVKLTFTKELTLNFEKTINVETKLFELNSNYENDLETSLIVQKWFLSLEHIFKKNLFYINVPIDTRSVTIRKSCNSISNFSADLIRLYYNSDVVISNSGSIRLDSILNNCSFQVGTLKKMIPFCYKLVKLKMKVSDLKKTLEQSMLNYPKLNGSYPFVSGISVNCKIENNNKTNLKINESSTYVKVINIYDINKHELFDDDELVVITREKLYEGLDNWSFNGTILNLELDKVLEQLYIDFFENLKFNILKSINENCEYCGFSYGRSNEKEVFDFSKKFLISDHLKDSFIEIDNDSVLIYNLEKEFTPRIFIN